MPIFINIDGRIKNEDMLYNWINNRILYKKQYEGYLIHKYHSIKSTTIPFMFNIFNLHGKVFNIDVEPLFDKFIDGIILRIITCTFKYKMFIDDSYINKAFGRYKLLPEVKDILHEKIITSFFQSQDMANSIKEKIDKKYHNIGGTTHV